MRTMPLFISCLFIAGAFAGCRREAPDTADTTERVTVPEVPASTAPTPAAATEAGANALQLVTAGVDQPYLADSAGRALLLPRRRQGRQQVHGRLHTRVAAAARQPDIADR